MSEATILGFVRRSLPATRLQASEQHLAGCSECRCVVSHLAQTLGEGNGGDEAAPRAALEVADSVTRTTLRPVRAATFAPGALVAQRYRIERFIAKGGMGEVYAAEDLELGERVALKTLERAGAGDRGQLARLKREMHLAHQITHPNVCRLFDLGFHDDGRAGIALLTMELVAGETLAARLQRQGRLAPAEALPIVEQMAAGLAAVHAVGVVHRDFKSSNVLLVGAPDAPGGVRVVLIDFGLARGDGDGAAARAAATAFGMVVGTPTYMAPEQLEGRLAQGTSDIYALGVVMFEMLTGRLPFVADTPSRAGELRLRQAPPRPSALVPELEPPWEAVILRCLARDPAARFQRAAEVAAALHVRPSRRGRARPGPGRPRRDGPGWGALAALRVSGPRLALAGRLLGLLLLLLLAVGDERPGPSPLAALAAAAGATAVRPSLALLDLEVPRAEAGRAWWGVAAAELMRAQLGATGRVRLGDSDAAAQARAELGRAGETQARAELGRAGETQARAELGRAGEARASPTLMRALRRRLAVDFVVAGALVPAPADGGGARLELRVFGAGSDEPLLALSERAEAADPLPAAARLGERLGRALGAGAVDEAARARARQALPGPPEALRLYAEGLGRQRRGDSDGARELWQRAVALAPAHPRLQAALSSAQAASGRYHEATAAAARALEHAGGLPALERLALQARADALAQRWSAAAAGYRMLMRALPDDLTAALALAAVERTRGHAGAAYEALAVARRLSAPLGDDPALDLDESMTALVAGDWPRARVAADRAARRALARDATAVAAAARRVESAALLRGGETVGALAAAQEALRLAARAGQPAEQNDALLALGVAQAQAADLEQAEQSFTQALERARGRGDLERQGGALGNLALIAERRGDLERAARCALEAAAVAGSGGEPRGHLAALANAAELLRRAGKLGQSDSVVNEWLALARTHGARDAEAAALATRARLRRDAARLDEALAAAEAALLLGGERDQASVALVAELHLWLGDVAGARRALDACASAPPAGGSACLRARSSLSLVEADLPAARRYAEQALAVDRLQKDEGAARASQRALGAVQLEANEPQALLALTTAPGAGGEEELRAALLAARAWLGQHHAAVAQAALVRALERLGSGEELLLGLEAQAVQAAVAAALGDRAGAAAKLASLVDEARRRRLVALELEAQLAAATLALGGTDRDGARAQLSGLRRRAAGLGFRLIARKAAALLAHGSRTASAL